MAMLDAKMKKRLRVAVIVVIAAGAALWAWRSLRPHGLPEGFASSNGRIEATEIDVAAKIAGRIREILVKEGDLVAAGQVLARMDTDVLRAQRREAEARVNEALIAVETAKAEVAQREAEKLAAQAVVEQRAAELYAAEKRFVRSEPLEKERAVTAQQVDDDRARVQAGRAAVSAAKAQVAASDAAIARRAPISYGRCRTWKPRAPASNASRRTSTTAS